MINNQPFEEFEMDIFADRDMVRDLALDSMAGKVQLPAKIGETMFFLAKHDDATIAAFGGIKVEDACFKVGLKIDR